MPLPSLLANAASRAWSAGLDLLYPPRCVGCGAFDRLLCAHCEAALQPATGVAGRCPFCAAAWDGEGNCPRCFHLQDLDGVLAAVVMQGAARRLVHALKYEGVRLAAQAMAPRLQPLRERASFDAVLPVPLHRWRLRSRGFNQAALLASATGWPLAPGGLVRRRRTPSQVGRGTRERLANVAGAFAYEGPPITGLSVAVLDDVVTTGSTAVECARVLREQGAAHVWAVAFARADYRPGHSGPILD